MARTPARAEATSSASSWKGATDAAAHSAEIKAAPGRLSRFGEGADIADLLPAPGARKLRELRQARDELSIVSERHFETFHELQTAKLQVQARITVLRPQGSLDGCSRLQAFAIENLPSSSRSEPGYCPHNHDSRG